MKIMKRFLCVCIALLFAFIATGCVSDSEVKQMVDDAYKNGYDSGYDKGYEKGHEEGIETAWEEARSVLSDINNTMEKGTEEFHKYGYMTDKAAEYFDKVFSIIGEYY